MKSNDNKPTEEVVEDRGFMFRRRKYTEEEGERLTSPRAHLVFLGICFGLMLMISPFV